MKITNLVAKLNKVASALEEKGAFQEASAVDDAALAVVAEFEDYALMLKQQLFGENEGSEKKPEEDKPATAVPKVSAPGFKAKSEKAMYTFKYTQQIKDMVDSGGISDLDIALAAEEALSGAGFTESFQKLKSVQTGLDKYNLALKLLVDHGFLIS